MGVSLNQKIKANQRTDGLDDEIKGVLSLCFDDLPYNLKPCFLYLRRFKEDESIMAEELCLLWMAEARVLPEDQKKDETLMDVAKRYLSELTSRSMVQEVLSTS